MEAWAGRNAEYIAEKGLTSREREVPEPEVAVAMEAGKVYATADLPGIAIAEGVKASRFVGARHPAGMARDGARGPVPGTDPARRADHRGAGRLGHL